MMQNIFNAYVLHEQSVECDNRRQEATTGRLMRGDRTVNCIGKEAHHTDKKENKIFLKYKEIQKGAVAMSYMTNGFLIYD
jgi:hypothetical protein